MKLRRLGQLIYTMWFVEDEKLYDRDIDIVELHRSLKWTSINQTCDEISIFLLLTREPGQRKEWAFEKIIHDLQLPWLIAKH